MQESQSSPWTERCSPSSWYARVSCRHANNPFGIEVSYRSHSKRGRRRWCLTRLEVLCYGHRSSLSNCLHSDDNDLQLSHALFCAKFLQTSIKIISTVCMLLIFSLYVCVCIYLCLCVCIPMLSFSISRQSARERLTISFDNEQAREVDCRLSSIFFFYDRHHTCMLIALCSPNLLFFSIEHNAAVFCQWHWGESSDLKHGG